MPWLNDQIYETTLRGTTSVQGIDDTVESSQVRGPRTTQRSVPQRITTVVNPQKVETTAKGRETTTATEAARTTSAVKGGGTTTEAGTNATSGSQTVQELPGATISFKIIIRGGLQGAGSAPPI